MKFAKCVRKFARGVVGAPDEDVILVAVAAVGASPWPLELEALSHDLPWGGSSIICRVGSHVDGNRRGCQGRSGLLPFRWFRVVRKHAEIAEDLVLY
jgi:hypothetical protein